MVECHGGAVTVCVFKDVQYADMWSDSSCMDKCEQCYINYTITPTTDKKGSCVCAVRIDM